MKNNEILVEKARLLRFPKNYAATFNALQAAIDTKDSTRIVEIAKEMAARISDDPYFSFVAIELQSLCQIDGLTQLTLAARLKRLAFSRNFPTHMFVQASEVFVRLRDLRNARRAASRAITHENGLHSVMQLLEVYAASAGYVERQTNDHNLGKPRLRIWWLLNKAKRFHDISPETLSRLISMSRELGSHHFAVYFARRKHEIEQTPYSLISYSRCLSEIKQSALAATMLAAEIDTISARINPAYAITAYEVLVAGNRRDVAILMLSRIAARFSEDKAIHGLLKGLDWTSQI